MNWGKTSWTGSTTYLILCQYRLRKGLTSFKKANFLYLILLTLLIPHVILPDLRKTINECPWGWFLQEDVPKFTRSIKGWTTTHTLDCPIFLCEGKIYITKFLFKVLLLLKKYITNKFHMLFRGLDTVKYSSVAKLP